ncbi:MAG: class I SAM-dependent methyltransferase [Cyanobacteria bacterium P01_D01_bin.105]
MTYSKTEAAPEVASATLSDAIPLPKRRPSFAYTMNKVVLHLQRYDRPKVLDIGCGRKSDIGRYLKEHRSHALIHGADLDRYSLKNRDVDELFICDAADMPFENGSYDVVFSQFLLEHVKDSQETVDSIARVTAPGGLATLIVPNPTSPASIVAKMTPYSFHLFFKRTIQKYDNVSEDTFPTFFAFKSVKTLKNQMLRAGFTDVEAAYVPEMYFRFRYRPVMIRLAMVYTKILKTLKLNFLKSSVVVSGVKIHT